ncbi:MAG TPA: hypothetical protein VGR29_08075, partial [Thermomicrobiales bacterium]|nr:hypothetical protein [Thermomicrobiales bacterium]
ASRTLRVPLFPEIGEHWDMHYRAIAAEAPKDAKDVLPEAVDVVEGGIRLGTIRYPAVLMEWIDGPTVLQGADRAARAGNTVVLRAFAEALKDLAGTLRRGRMVHGDLAADNLLMRSTGDLVCVDLDGLSWLGSPAAVSREVSVAYRHPGRSTSSPQRDAFALLVQYVSLAVLADDPDLRRSYGDPVSTHGGAILFSSWDLRDPLRSRTFADVRDRVGPTTAALVDDLQRACLGDASEAPSILSAVLQLPNMIQNVPVDAAEETTTWDLSRVIDRLKTHYPEQQETRRLPAVPAQPPASESQGFAVSGTVTEDRERLREAIAQGNDAEVIQWAVRLADDPVAQLYKLDVERVLAVGYRSRIEQAAAQGQDETVVLLAEQAESRQLPLDATSRRAVRNARERIEVRGKLEAALTSNDRAALADLAVSGELVVLGDADRASLQRVLQAIEWPSLQRALETDEDSLILEAFDEELFVDGSGVPTHVRSRLMLARERVAWISDVRTALKRRNARELARLYASEPEGGLDRLRASERTRASRMLRQQAALDALQGAMQTGNDISIVEALHAIERTGARIEDRFAWTAVQGVMRRATLIESIVAAANADPADDRQLAHLLPAAKTMGLMHDPLLQGELAWDRLQEVVVRGAALRRIRRAIAADDDRAIRKAAFPDVTAALQQLTTEERARVDAALQRRRAG